MASDPRIDVYIAARAEFARPILVWFRERIHAACPQAVETIKWSMPFFTYKGKPLANMAGFKGHARFGFWRRDPVTGAPVEASARYADIKSLADLPAPALVEQQAREAMALIDAGAKTRRAAPVAKPPLEVPPELAAALVGDAAASTTFEAFPPSCRREYCEWIAEAKRPETKAKRVADAVAWMREGKRRNWKYETA